MNVSNFISPLETVQVFSIFTYVNTLSDFLFSENLLAETDQHKHIPVVNALYHYILDKNGQKQPDLQRNKLYLVRRLINGTDLYGAKEGEILDLQFVNTLINHIVDSLVFGEFGNVYGFIAHTVRLLNEDSLDSLLFHLKKTLMNLRFENEYGEDSSLEPLAIDSIYQDLILSLFPQPKENQINVTSIDYIYAQAGLMFIRSGQKNMETIVVHQTKNDFQEFIQLAHTLEQLILSKKINESVLQVFALPALMNYFYKEKETFGSESTVEIISSPDHWTKAYRSLFSRLNKVFLEIENVHENDYRYQFFLAFSNFKNRTSLARETIENNCSPMTEEKLEEEILRYMNHPGSYSCESGDGTVVLEDLNANFRYLVNNVTQKYFNYEKESCLEAFGEEFKNSVDKEKVVINQGIIHVPYLGSKSMYVASNQWIRESDDMFEFYFPNNETYRYLALIRKNFTVTLIKEEDGPELFREKLGLSRYESFSHGDFPISVKQESENFDKFLDNIAKTRSSKFGINLQSINYDQTRAEWWEDFGLSLIPFFSCVKGIREKNDFEASVACTTDLLFLLPIIGEVGPVLEKITLATTRSILELSETTLRTITLRMTLRAALKVTGVALLEEINQFTKLFTTKIFKDLGIAVVRFLDPGFELTFNIGKKGLGSIRALITRLEKRHLLSLGSVKSMLERSQTAIANFPKKVGEMFGRDVYVNSVESGYGYRFFPLKDGKVAEIRTTYLSKEEKPLLIINSEEKVYQIVNVETEEIIGKDYLYDEEGFVVSDEQTYEMEIKSDEGDGLVELGNIFIPKISRLMPKKVLSDAVELALKKSKLSKMEIQKKISQYTFQGSEHTEQSLVNEWINSVDQKMPSWAQKFKIEESDIFFKLKYKEVMEVPELSEEEAILKIETLYPMKKYAELRQDLPVELILDDFRQRKVYNLARFEDYYALRYYGDKGYIKMAESSHEVRRMKNAIYRLAIRQSEDPGEQYVKRLFRGEARLEEAMEKELYPGRTDFELKRFTSASTDFKTADTYSEMANPLFTKVIYEMKFDQPYIRSRVEHIFVLDEKETILLPGTKFQIDSVTREIKERPFGKQNYIKVELSHVGTPIFEDQKRIMKEIKKLKETDTIFYA